MTEAIWQDAEQQMEQCIQLLDYTEDKETENKLQQAASKIARARSLLPNLLSQEAVLKKQCLSLTTQKTIFLKRLQLVEELGNKMDWQHQLLAQIRPMIEATRKRLREAAFQRKNKTS